MRLLQKHYDPRAAILRFRRFAYYFAANFRFGHTLYSQISAAGDFTALEKVIKHFFSQGPDVLRKPNMNYFR
jgi:hypothetical protein